MISKHTMGQIVVLSAGAAVVDDYQRKRIEKETKRSEKGESAPPKRMTLSELKKLSKQEYEAYIASSGGGELV